MCIEEKVGVKSKSLISELINEQERLVPRLEDMIVVVAK